MSGRKSNRRTFLRQSLATGAVGLGVARMTASSYARVLGANDRINLGLIGCGGRGRGILSMMVAPANGNATLVAMCDIWKLRQDSYPAEAEKVLGTKPQVYADHHKLLEQSDVDAVIIATPDHQHTGQTIDAVQAGKHVYVEKPIIPDAIDLESLNKCNDVVKASKVVVQHGTQGVSCPAARAIKETIASGRLGKLFRVQATESWIVPYWTGYQGPKSESETNWKAFLYNRKDRPFDANQHAKWMGYHEFSSGAIAGWLPHFINTLHFVTGCDGPVAATAWGGRYAPKNDPRCDAPDQVAVILEYAEGFHAQFTSHFGSTINNETIVFMFEKGSIRTKFGHDLGNPVLSSEGVNDQIKPEKLLETDPVYPGAAHVKNWFDCIRGGGLPNAHMDFGYKQGVAVALGDAAYLKAGKVTFDKAKREIR